MKLLSPGVVFAALLVSASFSQAAFQVNDVTVNEAVGNASIDIILTAPLGSDATIEWETVSDSAQPVLDYTASSGLETDGTWYITVYSDAPFQCDLANRDPSFNGAVQPIDFLDAQAVPAGPEPNPKPARAGWVYFLAQDIAQQNGILGWELTLLNEIVGAEIAVRQNAIPGRMKYRKASNNSGVELTRASIGTQQRVHLDASSTLGFLQRPSQQADVWYVGVYLQDQALGAFDLQRTNITPPLTPPNATNIAVAGHLPRTWKFYRFDILDGIRGWEKELLNVTGGLPRIVTRRAQLPNVVSGDDRSSQTTWPNGIAVTHLDDWFDRPSDLDRRASLSAAGKPLELSGGSAVTYYVGIFNDSTIDTSNYTFRSRIIGPRTDEQPIRTYKLRC